MNKKEYAGNYYKTHKEKMNQQMKELRKIKKDKYNKKEREWASKNKDKKQKSNAKWYAKNKIEHNKKRREQYKLNRPEWSTYEHRKEYLKKWQAEKRKKDLLYTLNSNISRRLRKDLKRFNETKKESIQKMLPYTMAQLKEHIEKQFTPEMNWNNMGIIWEVDHKTPLSWAKTKEELLELWALINLQPMKKEENKKKQASFSSDLHTTLSLIGR